MEEPDYLLPLETQQGKTFLIGRSQDSTIDENVLPILHFLICLLMHSDWSIF